MVETKNSLFSKGFLNSKMLIDLFWFEYSVDIRTMNPLYVTWRYHSYFFGLISPVKHLKNVTPYKLIIRICNDHDRIYRTIVNSPKQKISNHRDSLAVWYQGIVLFIDFMMPEIFFIKLDSPITWSIIYKNHLEVCIILCENRIEITLRNGAHIIVPSIRNYTYRKLCCYWRYIILLIKPDPIFFVL